MNQNELIDFLIEEKFLNSSSVKVKSLSGGVSCEILLIDNGDKKFVLKRALAKLKVKDEWFADVNRNRIEQKYIKYVADFLPEAVPNILYTNHDHCFFCMEMLENGLENWKDRLLKKQIDLEYAKIAGGIMGTIHSKSAGDPIVERDFDTLNNFSELRIEPYLIKTAELHPELKDYFYDEAKRLAAVKKCLVHGDFSPKNILVSPERVVLLDCEVAWYGDPIFDVAFFLNHFILKALYAPDKGEEFVELSKTALKAYQLHSGNIYDREFEHLMVHLLLLLMMARVDGKSPVEYLNVEKQQKLRKFVYQELSNGTRHFETLVARWLEAIKGFN
ncbi:phosphotransferase family protein [Arenibacter troitsensis]|uniref:Phosphotransferase enzyme family protein n=1 Tax=Arenibacter troitsensis TaxID=188872 RepID=A0A1X7KIQ6_9FLAO|nr:aminoglycoside phosphotransferase family protein [Arenibacter troitsensis]SMG41253.1 Phosphotransferase enzyme family protein [Arenibacter troitsensis]